MRCPVLKELPPSPEDKTGWPWTEESPQLPQAMPDGSPWPKVSIVTPSYNQGQFLEETIRSVLLQGYPNLEYVIIDGGSTDNSVEIIKKYEPWLTYWVSEPDRGQAHAINKGLKIASGNILAWINSDDLYVRQAIAKAVRFFVKNNTTDVLYGDCLYIDKDGEKIRYVKALPYSSVTLYVGSIPQPSTFFRKRVLSRGLLDETLDCAFDYEYWLRLFKKYRFTYISTPLSCFRLHETSKTVSQEVKMREETYQVLSRFIDQRELCNSLKERLLLLAQWKLSVSAWLDSRRSGPRNFLDDVENALYYEVPFVQSAVLSLMSTCQFDQIRCLKKVLENELLSDFLEGISARYGPVLRKRMLAQYYLTLAVETKSVKLFFRGILESPIYSFLLVKRRLLSFFLYRNLPWRVKKVLI